MKESILRDQTGFEYSIKIGKDMRIFLIVLSVLAISSCVFPMKQKTNGSIHKVHISYIGAINDLSPGIRTPQVETFINVSSGDLTISNLPTSHAVTCNTDKTDCTHAIIETTVEATYTAEPSGRLHILGTLKSQMGRSATFDGNTNQLTRSINDSVPVTATQSEEKAIDAYILKGEKLTLEGLAGIEVTFSLK